MKIKSFLILTILFAILTFTPDTFAQDVPQWHLPEGAKARLGKGALNDIAYSPDGARLAVASSIGTWLYDARTGKELELFAIQTDWDICVAFSPDGKTLASGSTDDTIRLLDVETGTLLHTLTGHTGHVNSVAFSPDGKTIASGGYDGTILLWEIASLPLTEDVNMDGIVNIQDLVIVANAFGKAEPDFNGDGVVNIQDLAIVANAFGNTVAAL